MNIKQLQILDAVVRLGSYRKAAAQLRCSQSTVTFQLKNSKILWDVFFSRKPAVTWF